MKQFLISYELELQEYPDRRRKKSSMRIVYAQDERSAEIKLRQYYESKYEDPYGTSLSYLNVITLTEAIL